MHTLYVKRNLKSLANRNFKPSFIYTVLLGFACLLFSGVLHAHDAEHKTAAADTNKLTHLVDQKGNRFNRHQLKGKTVLLNFIYTNCPGPCPIQTSQLLALQKQLTPEEYKKLHILSVSVDPATDTPVRLGNYAKAHGVSLDNWTFVTGPNEMVSNFITSFGADVTISKDNTITHSLYMYLIGKDGDVWQSYPKANTKRLLIDMRNAHRIASNT